MAQLRKLKSEELIGSIDNTDVYPITLTDGVFNQDNKNVNELLDEKANVKHTHKREDLDLEDLDIDTTNCLHLNGYPDEHVKETKHFDGDITVTSEGIILNKESKESTSIAEGSKVVVTGGAVHEYLGGDNGVVHLKGEEVIEDKKIFDKGLDSNGDISLIKDELGVNNTLNSNLYESFLNLVKSKTNYDSVISNLEAALKEQSEAFKNTFGISAEDFKALSVEEQLKILIKKLRNADTPNDAMGRMIEFSAIEIPKIQANNVDEYTTSYSKNGNIICATGVVNSNEKNFKKELTERLKSEFTEEELGEFDFNEDGFVSTNRMYNGSCAVFSFYKEPKDLNSVYAVNLRCYVERKEEEQQAIAYNTLAYGEASDYVYLKTAEQPASPAEEEVVDSKITFDNPVEANEYCFIPFYVNEDKEIYVDTICYSVKEVEKQYGRLYDDENYHSNWDGQINVITEYNPSYFYSYFYKAKFEYWTDENGYTNLEILSNVNKVYSFDAILSFPLVERGATELTDKTLSEYAYINKDGYIVDDDLYPGVEFMPYVSITTDKSTGNFMYSNVRLNNLNTNDYSELFNTEYPKKSGDYEEPESHDIYADGGVVSN